MQHSCVYRKQIPVVILVIIICSNLFVSAVNPAIELYQQGEKRLQTGEIFGAIDLFKESLSYNPDYVQPLYGLGRAYFKLEEYEQALIYIKRARQLDRSNSQIAALEGRIYTGLGQFEQAEGIFNSILSREPYNLDAQFGIAELHAAMGNIQNAVSRYRRALESDPYNRRGLLSAALLYAAQDNSEEAAELIQTAVDSYPEDPRVHSIAAEYYYQIDEIRKSEQHARQALQLNPQAEEAIYVLIRILFAQNRYNEAAETVEQNINIDRDNPLLWYLRGKAYWEAGDEERALESFYTSLNIAPSDEITRLALEEFLLDRFPPDAEERVEAATTRFNYGSAYERDNRIELARQEYRRGLMLHPYNQEGRVKYATTFKRTNNIGKYLSILKVVDNEGEISQEIKDEIEIYQSLREDSVAQSWDVDQFSIDRHRYKFAIFTNAALSNLIHLQSAGHLTSYMRGVLQGNEHIEIDDIGTVNSFAEAFKQARKTGVDFFVLLNYQEGERAFKTVAKVYNGSTGTIIKSFESLRTGNRRVSQALIRISGNIADELPLRGTIYRRENDTVLIDVGSFQGITPEDRFDVIRTENLELSDITFGLEYSQADILGQVEVTGVDDLLSVGQVETDQFFDLVNAGDAVIPVSVTEDQAQNQNERQNDNQPSTEEPEPEEPSIIPSEIYKSLLEIE